MRGDDLEIFLATAPGLEEALREEVRGKGFRRPEAVPGGVVVRGGWPDAWRANLWVRGAGRVLVRVAAFRAVHLAQLDQRARRVEWGAVLRPDVPVRVEAACRGSRIWHSGAAAERVGTAIRETLGAPVSAEGGVAVMVRVEDDLCTISVDTSGEALHRRGFKQAVNRAPMRETLASLFLRQCGYDGREPVVDPMCGSGTFVIEAAEIAAGLNPGRARRFAFERLATFEAAAWERMRGVRREGRSDLRFHGSDRDAGAVTMSRANAERAGVAGITGFRQGAVSGLVPPEGPPGLVIVNPPYGGRIGEAGELAALYRALGGVLVRRFAGWRVGIVTSEARLARATGLPLEAAGPPVPHGGIRVSLFRAGPLG